MSEALQIIAYQKEQIRERDGYIKALHTGLACLGLALIVVTVAFVYVCW